MKKLVGKYLFMGDTVYIFVWKYIKYIKFYLFLDCYAANEGMDSYW